MKPKTLLLAFLLFTSCATVAAAQALPVNQPAPSTGNSARDEQDRLRRQRDFDSAPPTEGASNDMDAQDLMEFKRNQAVLKQRAEGLKKDSERLAQLANELQKELANGAATISVSAMKKAEEAEKLSKKIKNTLKEGVPSGKSH